MSEFKSDNSVGRVAKNGVFTVIRFGVYTLYGIILIPFFLRKFGAESYGLIALAGILTQYVGLVSGCVGTSVSRFMNIALNRNDWKQANEIFNTALVANLGFIILQAPIYVLGVWKLDWLIDFPPELATDFRLLVIFNILLFFVHIIQGVVFSPILAANRLDIVEKFNLLGRASRLVLLLVVISLAGPHLWIIGAIELGVSLISFAVGLFIYRKLIDRNIVFRRKYITKKWVRPVLNMAGWMLVMTLGQALFLKMDVWVLNKFDTPEIAGIYAALLVWPNFLRQIGNQLANLISPVYMIDFAKENLERIRKGCLFLTKSVSLLGALAGGVLCGGGPLLLRVWLGQEFTPNTSLFVVMILAVVMTLNKAVIWPIFPAFNKVNQIGLVTLYCGALNLILSIVFVLLGWGATGVASATLISLFLMFGIIYPLRVSRLISCRYLFFMRIHLMSAVLFSAVVFGLSFILQFAQGWWVRIPIAAAYLAALATVSFLVVYSRAEKEMLFEKAEGIKGVLNGLFQKT